MSNPLLTHSLSKSPVVIIVFFFFEENHYTKQLPYYIITPIKVLTCGPKGVLPKKLGRGCAARFPKPLPLFMTKICDFPYPVTTKIFEFPNPIFIT